MICAWKELLAILPQAIRCEVDKSARDCLQEIRLRMGKPPELVLRGGEKWLQQPVREEDLSFCINAACQYSPWTASSAANGYITAPGGHRIGLCGEVVVQDGSMSGIARPTALCIRVARDFPGIAENTKKIQGSVLIIGKPGSGKTTLLRDLIRQRSDQGQGSVAVVDERGELFPYSGGKSCFDTGKRTDILSGCSKVQGIETVLRTMSPAVIAVDEITAQADCEAMLHACWCGVDLIATAHAGSIQDLRSRKVYQPIIQSGIFDTVIILRPDKSWRAERMNYAY